MNLVLFFSSSFLLKKRRSPHGAQKLMMVQLYNVWKNIRKFFRGKEEM